MKNTKRKPAMLGGGDLENTLFCSKEIVPAACQFYPSRDPYLPTGTLARVVHVVKNVCQGMPCKIPLSIEVVAFLGLD